MRWGMFCAWLVATSLLVLGPISCGKPPPPPIPAGEVEKLELTIDEGVVSSPPSSDPQSETSEQGSAKNATPGEKDR